MSKSEVKARASVVVQAPKAKVFRAWTEPEQLRQWFCPSNLNITEFDADVRSGGRFRAKMVDEKGNSFVAIGMYEQVVAEEKLVFSHGWEGPFYLESTVIVNFADRYGATEIKLSHERLPNAEAAKGHEEGWRLTLENLIQKIFPPRAP